MTQLQVLATGHPNELFLSLTYPSLPNLTYNFKLQLRASQQTLNGQLTLAFHKVLYIPEREIRVAPLEGNHIYKVEVTCASNGKTFTKNVFTFVPSPPSSQDSELAPNDDIQIEYFQAREEVAESRSRMRPGSTQGVMKPKAKESIGDAFCRSEDFMRMVGKSVGIKNQKKLDRYILQGRKCKNTSQFLNTRKQFQSGNAMKAIQKQKMILKGKMVFRDVYQQGEGMTFFKNDWFMGPFYSYDKNQKGLAKDQ